MNKITFPKRSPNCYVAILGSFGFHAAAIARETGLSVSQVYTRLRAAGIKLRDYRNMRGPYSKVIVQRSRKEVEERLVRRLMERR